MADSIIHANLLVSQQPSELFINGMPVLRLEPARAAYRSIPVQQFLVEGRNELTLQVAQGSSPHTALAPRGGEPSRAIEAHAKLVRYREGEDLDNESGETLADLRWAPDPSGLDLLPHLLVGESIPLPGYGAWAWQTAPELRLDDELRSEVLAFLIGIRDALQAGDPGPYVDAAQLKYRESARAYDFGDAAASRQNFVELIHSLRDDPAWQLDPIDLNTLDLRIVGRGRVVDCRRKDWEPALKTGPMEHGLPRRYPVLLCRQGRRLVIVR